MGGLMVGLNSEEFTGKFTSLGDGMLDFFRTEKRTISVGEIIRHFASTRELINPSICNFLAKDERYRRVGSQFILAEIADDNEIIKIDDDDLLF
jgi:hypothetical protein